MDKIDDFNIVTFGGKDEEERRNKFIELFRNWSIPDNEFLMNLGLFLTPQTLSRILFLDFLYKKIIDIQGIVVEFGCRWGQGVSVFNALRGIYEPFNRLRKIVGFDTFEGFPTTTGKDGEKYVKGGYSVTPDYDKYLRKVLDYQEQESPLSHIKKYEIVRGDVTVTLEKYLEKNPETIIALAYFDLDIYEPTHKCLNLIKDRITRGTVLGFDELNDHACPGETTAVKEVFGLDKFSIKRYPYNSRTSYLVIE
jgi:hypothetical protein